MIQSRIEELKERSHLYREELRLVLLKAVPQPGGGSTINCPLWEQTTTTTTTTNGNTATTVAPVRSTPSNRPMTTTRPARADRN